MTARTMRARGPVAVSPSHVSQLTCLAVAGIDPRRYLDLLGAHPEVPRSAVGRLRIVTLEDLRGLYARLAATATAETLADVDDDDQPRDADDVLRSLGLRRLPSMIAGAMLSAKKRVNE